jgi:hypothetical protein
MVPKTTGIHPKQNGEFEYEQYEQSGLNHQVEITR